MPSPDYIEPSASAWKPRSLRFTGFASPEPFRSAGWWKDVAGSEPETSTRQPRTDEFQEEGQLEEGKLVLKTSLGRVDWLLSADGDAASGLAVLGNVSTTFPRFVELAERWLAHDSCPPLQRVAFGCILLMPVGDLREGYKTLAGYLRKSVILDVAHSSDFSYQINKPCTSKVVPSLKINRISKWSVASVNKMQLVHAGSEARLLQTERTFACRLEMDINSDAENTTVFAKPTTAGLIRELSRFAAEICVKGDEAL